LIEIDRRLSALPLLVHCPATPANPIQRDRSDVGDRSGAGDATHLRSFPGPVVVVAARRRRRDYRRPNQDIDERRMATRGLLSGRERTQFFIGAERHRLRVA